MFALLLFVLFSSLDFGRSAPAQAELLKSLPTSTKFYFFYKHGEAYLNQTFKLDELVKIVKHPKYNRSSNCLTVLFAYGYLETIKRGSSPIIIDAYSERSDHNLIILDWSDVSKSLSSNYQLMLNLATFLGREINAAFDLGLSQSQFYLVAFSVASHMAGYIGRSVINESGGKKFIERMWALDPGRLEVDESVAKNVNHITKEAAQFLILIHTDSERHATNCQCGHIDFWANEGKGPQPGCKIGNFKLFSKDGLESHYRSLQFFAEIIKAKHTEKFLAVPANSWNDFIRGKIDTNNVIEMGLNCPRNATGNYYFKTNANSPFARGIAGISEPSKIKSSL